MLLSASTICLLACNNGLSLDWLIVDPKGFASQHVVTKEPGDLGHVLPEEKSDGVTCISPDDQNRAMRRCKLGNGWAPAVYCNWHLGDKLFACSDGSIREWGEIINWSCLTPIQWDQGLEYCQRKRRKNQ